MKYTNPKAIEYYNIGLQLEREESARDKDIIKHPGRPWFVRAELEELGVPTDWDMHGVIIVHPTKPWKRFIIATKKNKWCNANKYKWYYYTNLADLLKRIVT